MEDMALISQLRAVAASALALAVVTGGVVAFALSGQTTEITTAVPADVASASVQLSETEARELTTTSRQAEREALTTEVSDAAKERSASLSATDQAIDKTEIAIEAESKRVAAEKAAAQIAATEKAAKEKAAKAAEAKKNGYDPATTQPKEIARQMAQNVYGWGDDQFTCYDNIIMRESMWDPFADNPTSSAYGIPQALPGNKMASEGADWKTNPVTQIKWGLKYIKSTYGTPCQAWSFKRANGWY